MCRDAYSSVPVKILARRSEIDERGIGTLFSSDACDSSCGRREWRGCSDKESGEPEERLGRRPEMDARGARFASDSSTGTLRRDWRGCRDANCSKSVERADLFSETDNLAARFSQEVLNLSPGWTTIDWRRGLLPRKTTSLVEPSAEARSCVEALLDGTDGAAVIRYGSPLCDSATPCTMPTGESFCALPVSSSLPLP